MRPPCRVRLTIACFVLGVAAVAGAGQSPPKPPANDDCLACHGDPDAKRTNGSPVGVDASALAASRHGATACVDCHADLATLTEFPHPDTLKKAQCVSCHDAAVAAYETGVHAQARRSGQNLTAATCADCHGTHDIRPSADPESRTHHSKLLDTCGRCHGDEEIIKRGNIQIGNVVELFKDSIHGKALIRSGLTVAPTCSDCHGSHDIRRKSDTSSRVYRQTVPVTCGKCHEGIVREYWTSIHGAQVQKGSPLAPVCSSCHTAHDISRTDVEGWKVEVIKECGTCHEESMKTYRDTFHGQVTALGYSRVASCADCHGAHTIVPRADPRSMVNDANRVKTCQKCHSGATESFAQYDPHADPSNRARNPSLFYASQFMRMLLVGVFVFFGIHTGLWFSRGMQLKAAARLHERRAMTSSTPESAPMTHYRRFELTDRLLHGFLMFSFLGLAFTGMPLLFSYEPWAAGLARIFGGFQAAGIIHRFCAIVMIAVFVIHLSRLGQRLFIRKDLGILWGPASMVPQPRDFFELIAHLRWFVGLGPRPRFEHFTYWEKFDYWAVFWGMAIIGVSGLVLWFPEWFAHLLPGWLFNIAMLVHGEEALLAVGFIFTIHFFNSHLRPEKFPMDSVIFTGRVTVREMLEERQDEYARLTTLGRIDELASASAPRWVYTLGRSVGAVAVTLGLIMVGLILFALLTK